MKKQMLSGGGTALSCDVRLTQEWFARVITNPLRDDESIQLYSPGGVLIEEEAARYLVPSPTLRPHQRIQIYNQQYWWRLLNTLHAHFPLVTRLFGYHAFNEKIGIPYLLKFPPNHWSLTALGERLPKWVAAFYESADQPLVLNAANLDWAFTASFIAPERPPLDLRNATGVDHAALLSQTYALQPHLSLFKWDYDLFAFREAFLKHDVDYWQGHRFPELPSGRTYTFVLYRNEENLISWRQIDEGEYLLLAYMQTGATLTELCTYIEAQPPELSEKLSHNLEAWIQRWAQLRWLTPATQNHN